MNIQAPRGTKDIFGGEARAWRRLEQVIREHADSFGYSEIRTPIFEHTELFLRGVGETTDIVQKEMYSFNDKGGRSITLRPEQTAGAARAFIEHGMRNEPMPARFYYIGPNFRYENPQAGRLRQHHQLGIELYGAPGPSAEADIISFGYSLLAKLGVIGNIKLHINSLGCADCRPVYRQRLIDFIGDNSDKLCPDCKQRFHRNPLRVLDCKVEGCKTVTKEAPTVLEALDDKCRGHFESLQELLKEMNIEFTVDSKLVRGLDYYTGTVFEFIEEGMPTVIGGGRYDGLIEELGGTPTPAAGFGMGIERLMMLLKNQDCFPEDWLKKPDCELFIGHAGEEGRIKAQVLAFALKQRGIQAECDLLSRSVKAQMKYADKLGSRFSMIIGGDEIANNTARMKDMLNGGQISVGLEISEIEAAVSENLKK